MNCNMNEQTASGGCRGQEHHDYDQADSPIDVLFHSYTRKELVELGDLPLSKKRPDNLSPDFHNCDGIWDPEIWMRSFDGPRDQINIYHDIENDQVRSRPSANPKERLLKEERDGIVLSPQRKSFVTGCHVTTAQPHIVPQKNVRDSHTEEVDQEPPERDQEQRRERDMSYRRIGSGRITVDRDRFDDHSKPVDRSDIDHDDRRNNRRDDWRQRDRWDMHNHDQKQERGGRHERYRRRSNTHSEYEPEWFTAGPITQSDTIELRGFNDPVHTESPQLKEPNIIVEEKCLPNPSITPEMPSTGGIEHVEIPIPFGTMSHNMPLPSMEFDINQLFSTDAVPGLKDGSNLLEEAPRPSGSRFSQWFSNPHTRAQSTASGASGSNVNMDYDPIENLLAGTTRHSPLFSGMHTMSSNLNLEPTVLGSITGHDIKAPTSDSAISHGRFQTVRELESGFGTDFSRVDEVHDRSPHTPYEQPGEMSAFNKLVGMMKLCGSLPPENSREPQKLNVRQNPTIVTKPASPLPSFEHEGMGKMNHLPGMVSPNVLQQHFISQMVSTPRAQSPIMFGQQPPNHLNAPSPVHPSSPCNTSPNSLQVKPGSHSPLLARVPSPQELVVHTQAIMQNALIKKQLEEQKERFIKKQQRDRSPCDFSGQLATPQPMMGTMMPTRSGNSPMPTQTGFYNVESAPSIFNQEPSAVSQVSASSFPLTKTMTAFTPTSVIKKMAVVRSSSREKIKINPNTCMDQSPNEGQTPPQYLPLKPFHSLPSRPNTDPSRIMAVPPMPQQSDLHIRRALVGCGSMRSPSQMYAEPTQSPVTSVPSVPAHLLPFQPQMYHQGAHPPGAHPQSAHPQSAHPQSAHPQSAHPQSAHPQSAHPQGAHLQGAHPQGAHLQGSHPQGAHPQGALSQSAQSMKRMPSAIPRMSMSAPPPDQQSNKSARLMSCMGPNGPVLPGNPHVAPVNYPMMANPITHSRSPIPNVNPAHLMQEQAFRQAYVSQNPRMNVMNRGKPMQHFGHPNPQARYSGGPDPRSDIYNAYPGSAMAGLSPGNEDINYGLGPSIPNQPSVGGMMGGTMDGGLAKWFGTDVLNQHLPDMPPIPTQGQNVLTVDEIERRQQVVN